MNIELRRICHRPETIDGQIWIEGMKVCDCAENATSAIPVGTYPIILVKCKQYSRKMILLKDEGAGMRDEGKSLNPKLSTLNLRCEACPKLSFVSNNTTLPVYCPQIKPGNGVYNRTDGSIIVGKYLVPGCLSHPKQAFDALYDRIRKNIERGNPVMLTIVSEGSGIRV